VAESEKWIDGYAFWKGQYSVRNLNLIALVRRLVDRQIELVEKSKENLDWWNWINTSDQDPVEYISRCKEDCPVTLDEMRDVRLKRNELERSFPYYTNPNDPMVILNKIVSGDFPPIIGSEYSLCSSMDVLCPGGRSSAIYHMGLDDRGFEVISIDCEAEINSILNDVRKFVEKKKKVSAYSFCKSTILKDLKSEICASGSVYRIISNESRAIGLLLFDYLKKNEDSDAGAIRWAKNEIRDRGPKNFGKADSSDRQFQRWLTNTRKCIDAAEVLEI